MRDDASAGRESTFQSNTAHANTGAMVKKKGKNKSMDTGDDGFTYGEFAEACGQGKNGPSQPKLVCAFYPLLISACALCFLFPGEPQQSGPKKKRVIKLTHKQLKRKKMKKERGEALMDRRSKKTERDAARLDKKLAAKALW